MQAVVCNTEMRTVEEVVDGVAVTRCMQVGHMASTSICPTMAATLSRRTYDILHIHFPHPMGVMSYLASRKPRAHGLIVTYHSDVVKQERLLKLFRPFMHRVMKRADAIICTSREYQESSPDLAPYRAKCVCIPYGIDLAQFERNARVEAEAAAIRAKHGGPLIIAVGRLIYYKGFEHAIRAMRHVEGRLLIVGEGPLRADLERVAREAGVADRVQLLGEIHNQQIVPYYLASDVFVLPSIARSEAFGIVQLEAMACGLPVINTALDSGVPFVSLHGVTGLTVPPAQPEALAAAIRDLLNAPERRLEFGRAARLRVETEFRKEVMAERMIALYTDVLAGRRSGEASYAPR
jgi:rhamnosyl/mannosyltransferase